jgi:hypothetical protein
VAEGLGGVLQSMCQFVDSNEKVLAVQYVEVGCLLNPKFDPRKRFEAYECKSTGNRPWKDTLLLHPQVCTQK